MFSTCQESLWDDAIFGFSCGKLQMKANEMQLVRDSHVTYNKDLTLVTARTWYGFLFTVVRALKFVFKDHSKPLFFRKIWTTKLSLAFTKKIPLPFSVICLLCSSRKTAIKTHAEKLGRVSHRYLYYFQNNFSVLIKNVSWWNKTYFGQLIKGNIL